MHICQNLFSLCKDDPVVKYLLENDKIMCACGVCNFTRNVLIICQVITIEKIEKNKED